MKKLLALLLVFALLLCGCSSQKASDDNDDEEEKVSNKKDEDESSQDSEETKASDSDDQDEDEGEDNDVTEETQAPEVEISDRDKLMGTYFSDASGYWDGYTYTGSSYTDVIFDDNCQVVYAFPDDEEQEIYGCGRFISSIGKEQYLKDALGQEIVSTESLDISGFGMTYNTMRNSQFLADGYVLAYRITESYNSVIYEIGFLDRNGKWIVELSADNPIFHPDFKFSVTALEKDLIYVGDGCLMIPTPGAAWEAEEYPYDYRLYNIHTNQLYDITPNKSNSTIDYMCENVRFDSGISYDTYNTQMYEFRTDGSLEIYRYMPDDDHNWDVYEYLIKDGVVYGLLCDGKNTSIATKDGYVTTVEDLIITSSIAADDFFWIIIENAQNTRYYSAIDLHGKLLFEPVQTDANVICLPNGEMIISTVGQDTGRKIVIDENGQIIYESQSKTTEIEVRNGIVREAEDLDYTDYSDIYTKLP